MPVTLGPARRPKPATGGQNADNRRPGSVFRGTFDKLVRAFLDGPGMVVLKRALTDTTVVDAASGIFDNAIEEEHTKGTARDDHFAKPGDNDRVWKALDTVAVRAPEVFADYYACTACRPC